MDINQLETAIMGLKINERARLAEKSILMVS